MVGVKLASTNPIKIKREKLTYKEELKNFENTIYTIARMEYGRLRSSHLIDFNELLAIGTVVINDLFQENTRKYNHSYVSTAIKWAIRNELRRRYKWYSSKEEKSNSEEKNTDESVYTAILSINELSEQENPYQIADCSTTPEQECEFNNLSSIVKESVKKLSSREKSIIESRFYNDKKIKDIAEEFQISPSRVSRIIQSGLEKIKKDLEKQDLSTP